jgi:hypothetical protein
LASRRRQFAGSLLRRAAAADSSSAGAWEDLSGDGGVLKRVLEPGSNNGAPRPRHRSLCNVDFELRLVLPVGATSHLGDASPPPPPAETEVVLGSAAGYKFSLRATSDVMATAKAAAAAASTSASALTSAAPVVDASLPGFHLALPTMATGEVAELRLAPAYAFGARGAPPRVPPHAVVVCTLRLGFHQRYATGEVGKAEAEAWANQVRADPLLKQSTIAACEKEAAEDLEASAADAAGAAAATADAAAMAAVAARRTALQGRTVPELKAELKAKALKVSGAKAALVERLAAADATEAAAVAATQATAAAAKAASLKAAAADVAAAAASAVAAKPAKERVVVPADVQWKSVPASSVSGDPSSSSSGGSSASSTSARAARMLSDEGGKSAVDPRATVCGTESSPISTSVAAAAALDTAAAAGAPAAGGSGKLAAAEAAEAAGAEQRARWLRQAASRAARVSWDESANSLDVIVAFCADGGGGGGLGVRSPVRAADLEVTIKARSFKVVYRPKSPVEAAALSSSAGSAAGATEALRGEGTVLAAGELCAAVDPDASFWWIEDPPTDESDADSGDALGPGDEGSAGSETIGDGSPLVKFWRSGAAVQAAAKANTAVRATLAKRRPAIWAGVWKAELMASRAELAEKHD